MSPAQPSKDLGRVLLKALGVGVIELMATNPFIKAGVAAAEVIRREWFLAGQKPEELAEAIAQLDPQEALSAVQAAEAETIRCYG